MRLPDDGQNAKPGKAMLFGVGLDSDDGHTRVTKARTFVWLVVPRKPMIA